MSFAVVIELFFGGERPAPKSKRTTSHESTVVVGRCGKRMRSSPHHPRTAGTGKGSVASGSTMCHGIRTGHSSWGRTHLYKLGVAVDLSTLGPRRPWIDGGGSNTMVGVFTLGFQVGPRSLNSIARKEEFHEEFSTIMF
ncbi:hypothetical protein EDB89DRAFT_1908051 [Lactarius sanguifluus]|nr:hypothetical protein EDB89DRAFT_1908051 [Lactarius sanguifluus]